MKQYNKDKNLQTPLSDRVIKRLLTEIETLFNIKNKLEYKLEYDKCIYNILIQKIQTKSHFHQLERILNNTFKIYPMFTDKSFR